MRRYVFVFVALVISSISPDLFSAERNIVFFITDDESPTLGCYGDTIAKTPNIDQLARDGTIFKNGVCHNSQLQREPFGRDVWFAQSPQWAVRSSTSLPQILNV